MVIIGGVGSILGSFLGAAFITLFPIFLNIASGWLSHGFGIEISHATVSNLEFIIFGGLIIFFLIVEPTAWPGCGRSPRRSCACGRSRIEGLYSRAAVP